VSGTARGRALSAPLPKDVRPTTDRVKESIFDMLGSLGGVRDKRVLDLFCGSGALGIEALSRGASHVTFVDANREALGAAAANLAAVGLSESDASFVRASLPQWTAPEVDLVLMDPPYDRDVSAEFLSGLRAELVVIESRNEPHVPDEWMVHRQRRYGTTLVTVLIDHTAGEPS